MVRKIKEKSKEEKLIEKDERQMKLLEKLEFAQLMFAFYTAPVE